MMKRTNSANPATILAMEPERIVMPEGERIITICDRGSLAPQRGEGLRVRGETASVVGIQYPHFPVHGKRFPCPLRTCSKNSSFLAKFGLSHWFCFLFVFLSAPPRLRVKLLLLSDFPHLRFGCGSPPPRELFISGICSTHQAAGAAGGVAGVAGFCGTFTSI